ncbi:MAG TPA: COX15/CtaA family protein [Pyrinomonadaceae bacterium]|nr:COX15/CtaA family protein [Pyrinomonadaceae bacterium]
METAPRLSGFAKFAWITLAYNVLVILWGVFLRASKSGDGCGQYWLTCHGEVIPSAPELKTIIEFSHRMTTGPAFLLVLILLILAILKFGKGHPTAKAAIVSFVFIITEVLVGAGLVLTGNTAETLTEARPFWAIGHLINTFILLAALTLTAWFASRTTLWRAAISRKAAVLISVAVVAMLVVGTSGSVAALSNMLFPSETLTEGIAKDFSATSNVLVRLRLSHPVVSIMTGVYLIFLAGWMKSVAGSADATRWSNVVSILVIVQLAFGAATLLTLGPIIMQLGHLLLADLLWISFVILTAHFLWREDRSGGHALD